MLRQKNYPGAYKGLLNEFKNLKNFTTKLNFEEEDLNQIKNQLLEYDMSAEFDLVNLKDAQKFIKPIEKALARSEQDTTNFKALSMCVKNFNDNLNQVIEDIKLECIQNDWADNLLKIVGTKRDDINALDESGNTILMHATSLHCPSMRVINKLLELKADPFIPCAFDETPFSKAIKAENVDLAQKYLGHKASLLGEAAQPKIKGMMDKLCEASLPEDFYFTLAQDLSDSSFTEALGWKADVTDTCVMHIKDNYEILGKIEELPYEFQS
ncbi:hypothetical protein phytr_11180 [Candidatus Phycorickettsia trachydisci]|uniref:Ankyrin repeat-containing protein n=1 Tax=Candidatus Phycorickettsia trachydisci TaxID=2115978 RepID=A0A2P1P9U8_9RICK|nr:hypothetical protein [Candidatus Phycorickettsia trachydisci]AVP88043.1 hypothetical protein phytr_11180 [Candidatus Phycorickettsia trachydisci]